MRSSVTLKGKSMVMSLTSEQRTCAAYHKQPALAKRERPKDPLSSDTRLVSSESTRILDYAITSRCKHEPLEPLEVASTGGDVAETDYRVPAMTAGAVLNRNEPSGNALSSLWDATASSLTWFNSRNVDVIQNEIIDLDDESESTQMGLGSSYPDEAHCRVPATAAGDRNGASDDSHCDAPMHGKAHLAKCIDDSTANSLMWVNSHTANVIRNEVIAIDDESDETHCRVPAGGSGAVLERNKASDNALYSHCTAPMDGKSHLAKCIDDRTANSLTHVNLIGNEIIDLVDKSDSTPRRCNSGNVKVIRNEIIDLGDELDSPPMAGASSYPDYIPLEGDYTFCDEEMDAAVKNYSCPWYGRKFRVDKEIHMNAEDDDLYDEHSPDVPFKFSLQQMEVLKAVAYGKSVFLTGSAGTGKSFILKYIIRILKKALGKKSVYVTASTGQAACALNGTTLHYFAGIGLGSGTPERLASKVMGCKDSRKRWRSAKVLIIDEISMIDGELFDKLDYVARVVNQSSKCFGGIQLIVTGDFFQLPPVNPANHRKYFAFQADCWDKCFDLQVELEHVFRQSDGIFVKMLNEIRRGEHTSGMLQGLLGVCHRALPDDGTGIAPTKLYPLKVDVRRENMHELRALETSTITFTAVDWVLNPIHRYMLEYMRAEKELHLCVGAQVMLIMNLDISVGLVNGAKGVVVGFESSYTPMGGEKEKESRAYHGSISPSNVWPIVRFSCGVKTIGPQKDVTEDGGMEVASRIQVRLILSWALSVHKCQGMTLDRVRTDLSKAFDYGMVYVALSRVKSLDGLQLLGFDPTRIKVHPEVIAFSDKLAKNMQVDLEKEGM